MDDTIDRGFAADDARFYHLSGRFEVPGLLLGTLGGAATAWGIGLGYGIAAGFFATAWFTSIALLILVVIAGLLLARLMKQRGVRNLGAARVAGAITSAAFLLGGWTGWAWEMLAERSDLGVTLGSLLFDPRALWQAVQAAAELPTKDAPGPVWLAIGGAVEATLAFWLLPSFVASDIDGDIYCEDCGLWCEAEKAVLRLKAPAAIDVKARLLARDVVAIAGLEQAPGPLAESLEIDLYQCSGCTSLAAATLRGKKPKPVKKEGEKPTYQSETQLEKLLLSGAEADAIRAAARPAALAEAARETGDDAVES